MIFCSAFSCFRFCLQCAFHSYIYLENVTFLFRTNTKWSMQTINVLGNENQTKRIHLHINCVYFNINQSHFYIVQSVPWHFIQISNKIYIQIILCFFINITHVWSKNKNNTFMKWKRKLRIYKRKRKKKTKVKGKFKDINRITNKVKLILNLWLK